MRVRLHRPGAAENVVGGKDELAHFQCPIDRDAGDQTRKGRVEQDRRQYEKEIHREPADKAVEPVDRS